LIAHLKGNDSILKFFPKRLFLLLLLIFTPNLLVCEDLYFICNKTVKTTELSQFEIKNIFLGKKTIWKDGNKITIVILKKKKPFQKFLKTIVMKNPIQFQLYWRNMVFTGKGIIPEAFRDEDKVVAYVAKTDGAIGFVSSGIDTGKVKSIHIAD